MNFNNNKYTCRFYISMYKYAIPDGRLGKLGPLVKLFI